MELRKAQGFVRECHGDMHLGNVAVIDGELTLFDGIEFNPGLRWIDVISELAFLLMDLDDRGARRPSRRVLNTYINESGDFGGLTLVRLYQVYRALVRAKVSAIRASQSVSDTYTCAGRPFVWITHGFSGSGKSTLCSHLSELVDAVWLRSDLERKRLFGMAPGQREQGGVDEGIYSAEAGQRVYGRLAELAREIIEAGFPVIVDATFLNAPRRFEFRQLARICGAGFRILNLQADLETLRKRIERRASLDSDPSDADERVLARQLEHYDPLTGIERAEAIPVDTAALPKPADIERWINGS
jgi:predicted kinase